MLGKTMFKKSSNSYSQFLKPKEVHVHFLTEPEGVCVDKDFFKRSISLDYQQVYETQKWKNGVYRVIFFSFSLLFAFLGLLLFFKTTNFACGVYFKNCVIVKNYLNLSCLLLASTSLGLGMKISPEKDAMHYLVTKVEKEFHGSAKQLPLELNTIFANLSREWITPHQTLWIKKSMK